METSNNFDWFWIHKSSRLIIFYFFIIYVSWLKIKFDRLDWQKQIIMWMYHYPCSILEEWIKLYDS